ncbi:hypothetical protein IVB15_24900 [Bradyrhizobium sp. 182]|uniref:hypothetical protein n=1 Tax=unclassified Bradyrhizobium TaxID=2631580 RepID=UPI001FF7C7D9|nr:MULTISPECIES: hypothetical protein [unclassified Bradyrhizobium]MCK1424209.1 hypothetical protein [Bradyrhizobium sp. CW12]MCK1530854.1 hypothetical protein [Bradyrhizobium sp. 182]MCK1597137.1 hypothetical protein [Bradyrhizobium sp. 164]MCK1646971.1 hypothetical protein [Bradyrhizobium sp. 154]
MADESLLNEDWTRVLTQLGGAAQLEISARQTKAFVRRRQIPDAVSLLRLMLAYCLGERGLRSTAAWAASVGLADLSSVALFYRLRQCGDWFAVLVEGLLAAAAPKASLTPSVGLKACAGGSVMLRRSRQLAAMASSFARAATLWALTPLQVKVPQRVGSATDPADQAAGTKWQELSWSFQITP